MPLLQKYKGYEIWTTNSGGKAGKGHNITGSVQVRKDVGSQGYLLIKNISFPVSSLLKFKEAVYKAEKYIDELNNKENI